MTGKSFNQLAIMRKRVQMNRRIKDCAKLFFKEDFWYEVHQRQSSMDEHAYEHQLLIKQTLRQRGDCSQLSTKQFQWLIEACLFFLRNIFVSEAIADHHKRTSLEHLLIFKKEWNTVNWIITFKIGSIFQGQLFNQIDKYIDDERFKLFLHQLLVRIQQEEPIRYHALARDVYLTLHILNVLEHQQKVNKLKIFIDQHTLHLGLASTKKQTMATLKRLNLKVGAENECYFTHFSRPLQLQGYSIRRDWKKKRICIEVPQQMLIKLSDLFQYGDFHNQIAKARGALIHQPIRQIVSIYQQELEQIAHYYLHTNNYQKLRKLFYFAHLSLLKTIACKFGCTIGQARKKLKKYQINSFKLSKKEILQSESLKQSQLASRIL